MTFFDWNAWLAGLSIGISLLLAIGPQNAFVLRQGLMGQHVWVVVLFCSISDALLIALGVAGVSELISGFAAEYQSWLFGGAAVWLFFYGVKRGVNAWRGGVGEDISSTGKENMRKTLSTVALITFANPHVYLDTLVLIGTLSLQFSSEARFAFGCGAASGSLLFFSGLAFGASRLAPIMACAGAWRIIDSMVAGIMFFIAIGMLRAGDLL